MMQEGYTDDGTFYQTYGTIEDTPLILIHGLGLTLSTWDDYTAPLSEQYGVIRYDLFGHGRSALPPRVPDLSLFAEQIDHLMMHLKINKAVLIGFSLGGMINRRMALDMPQKVAGLVILNSPHARGESEQKKVETRAKLTAEEGIIATIDATLERWFTHKFRTNNPEKVNEIRQQVLANDLGAYAACRFVLAHGVIELINPAPPISCPSLVVTAAHDSGSTPHMSRAIAREISGAKCLIIQGLQHMGLVEEPEAFLQPIFNFLDDLRKQK